MISVIRIDLHTVLACSFNQTAGPGVTLYDASNSEVSNMFTVNFIFCFSKAYS